MLRLAPIELSDVVREAVAEQQAIYPERTLTLDVADDVAQTLVSADADRLAQVFTNYLTNALTYSYECQPVAVTVRLEPAHQPERVRVSVRDRGAGIPPAEQDRIWERFHRIEGQGHRSGSHVGLGLGLYISREIVERHGGAVGVESTPGAGSTFFFTLPLAPA